MKQGSVPNRHASKAKRIRSAAISLYDCELNIRKSLDEYCAARRLAATGGVMRNSTPDMLKEWKNHLARCSNFLRNTRNGLQQLIPGAARELEGAHELLKYYREEHAWYDGGESFFLNHIKRALFMVETSQAGLFN